MKLNESGPELIKIYSSLSELGYYNEEVCPATYDKEIENAVKQFQSEAFGKNGKPLQVDGIYGPNTRWAIDYALSTQPNKFWDFKREHLSRECSAFLKNPMIKTWTREGKNKYRLDSFDVEDGFYFLIKDLEPPDTMSSNYLRSFTGYGVLVEYKDGVSKPLTPPFPVSSHPGQATTRASGTPDVNLDGKADIAWIRQNLVYDFQTKRSGSRMRFNPKNYISPTHRDILDKGTLSENEREKLYDATAIQYHSDEGAGKPISVGCITSPLWAYDNVASPVIEGSGVRTMRLIMTYIDKYQES